MSQDYYNTNREAGEELENSKAINRGQQQRVVDFFRSHPGRNYSNTEIHDMLMPSAEKTSSQRCLTNLTNDGVLVKTEEWTISPRGKKVHTWKLKTEENGQMKLF